MKRVAVLSFCAVGALAALFGCRAVVGIEDLGGPEGNNRPGPDGGGAQEASVDAGDAGDGGGLLADAGNKTIDACRAGGDCRKCCKDAYTVVSPAYEQGAGKICVCQTCGTQCASTVCSGAGGKPDMTCAPCLDDLVASGACPAACAGSPDPAKCVEGEDCIQACGSGPRP